MITSLVKVGHIEWCQCKDPNTGEIFNLATPSSEKYLFQVTQLLKNEYQLRDRLTSDWAVKACGQALYFGRYALLYPAFSYRTLVGLLDQPPAPLAIYLNNAIQLCAVVSCAHRQGIVHADIKPANFFIFDDDSWRLRGFGLSSSGEATDEQPRPPAISGTLAYMSPEHTTRTTRQVTFQSDLYSLGIVLYELLTGKLPFGAPDGSLAEWVHHHIASEPVPHTLFGLMCQPWCQPLFSGCYLNHLSNAIRRLKAFRPISTGACQQSLRRVRLSCLYPACRIRSRQG
ncbi:protein kinase [Erwinia sp. E_sp_W01_6]|uniref:serine/threonine protein kinase n=1 Tax=Erwinia sp. E_sp_W01_6 TaxID=3039408 RepID=UPI0030CDD59E